MVPGDASDVSPFRANGTAANSTAAVNGTAANGTTANGAHHDLPPQPPIASTASTATDLHNRKSSLLSRASSFNMPKQRVQYPDFPEFDLSSDEVAELEELLHSTDESVGTLNAGAPTNPWKEVVLRLETMPRTLVKLIYNSIKLAIFVSAVSLILLFVAKMVDPNFGFYDLWFTWVQLAFASVFMVVGAYIWGEFVYRLLAVRKRRLEWSTRRHRLSFENFIQVTAVFITNIFWFAPNVYLLARDCSWFDEVLSWFSFVRWSMLFVNLSAFIIRAADLNVQTHMQKDGGKKEVMLLDNRYLLYFVFLLLWLVPSAFVLLRVVYGLVHDAQVVGVKGFDFDYDGVDEYFKEYDIDMSTFDSLNVTCNDLIIDCSQLDDNWTFILITAFVPLYFIFYVLLVVRAYVYLRKRPFASYRMANMLEMLTWRQQLSTFVLVLLSQVLLGWINHGDCATRMISWAAGLFPINLLLNGTILLPAVLFMPIIPCDESVKAYRKQLKLGSYLWTERSKPGTLSRVEILKQSSRAFIGEGEAFRDTFAVETAVKCIYYNWCVYLHSEDEDGSSQWGPMDIATAMSLYDLHNYDVIHEPSTSSKCLVMWGNKHLLLAFRGTVDMTGCFQNLKIWYAVHPPYRRVSARQAMLSRVPMCHRGFHLCWRARDFDCRVMETVQRVVESCGGPEGLRVTVTGHSLGAALAMLCAWDLQKAHEFEHLECYTYGAPHVGNMAFKSDFEATVPDCHNIINDQDAVARSGKASTVFVRLLERPGHKILVNKRGEMLVQPSPMEAYLQLNWGMASWEDHVLSSYDEVMSNVLRAQFTHFGLKHGLAGVLSIFQNTSLRRYYHAKGLDVYEQVHRLKLGQHHDGIVLSVTDRLASRLDKAMHRMSILRQSKGRTSHVPGKDEGGEEQGVGSGGRKRSKGRAQQVDEEQGLQLVSKGGRSSSRKDKD